MSATLPYPPSADRGQTNRTGSTSFSPTVYPALIQGVYYVLTGVWPLVSIDTFQMVTGPKTDLWLVQMAGALIAVIAAVLLIAVWRRRATVEIILLALASAMALTGVDVVFVVRQVIDPIYLLDAAAEGILIAMWIVALTIEARTMWKRSDTCV